MNKAFYTAGTGMRSFQKDMDIISNNISNINTVGYKGSR
ncbi:MAG: flagellar basal body protein, partial [Oscillospiraceae bacterium]